jgi:hypothetical protein
VYVPKVVSNQSNTSLFSNLLVFLVLLSCFPCLYCYERKCIRVNLTRQDSTKFHASHQSFHANLSIGHPSPRRRSTGASLAPVTTTTWKENVPAMAMFPRGWRRHGQKPSSPSNGTTLIMKDRRCKPVLNIPPPRWGQRHSKASSPPGRPLSWFSHVLKMKRILLVDFTSTQAQAKELGPLVR